MTAADRFIESAAVVSGGSAWLLSRILLSANVAKVIANPPSWLDRADLAATVAAIHRAASAQARRLELAQRETATVLDATAPDCPSSWTVQRAADYLRLSPRRVQEIALVELGGRRVGRSWQLDETAVRAYERQRRGAAA